MISHNVSSLITADRLLAEGHNDYRRQQIPPSDTVSISSRRRRHHRHKLAVRIDIARPALQQANS